MAIFKIEIRPVDSSNLAGIGYDPLRLILAVQFKDAHIYHYAGVPADVWREFFEAPSKGSYYALNIRGKYQAERVTGECPKCGDKGYLGERCLDCGCADYKGPLLHTVCYGHPDAKAKRAVPTDCGKRVRPSEIAKDGDSVTCPECRLALEGA